MTSRHIARHARRLATVMIGVVLVGGLLPATVLAANGPQFTTQPGGGTVGVAWATQPRVSIMKGANVDTSASGSITFSIRTGTAGAVLTCGGSGTGGRTFPVGGGVATAAGCSINLAGSGYVLTATWSGGGSNDSVAFSISGGPATKLAFTTQPGGGAAGVVWATQPVVTIQDAAGQTTNSTATVLLSIGSNPGGGILTCTGGLSKAAVNGVASFTGCGIDRTGLGYTLIATSSGLTSATSAAFTITSASAATNLAFTTQPSRGTPGGAFAVQPAVTIQDVNGATVTTSNATVTLSLSTNPGPGTLTCTGGLSKAAIAGVATFAGCAINSVGVGYTLGAASSGLTSAVSALFDVADRLVFATQPAGASPGIAFATQPVVAVGAGATNTATHDGATQVTLAIRAGTGSPGAVLTCTGGLTKVAVNGVATFAGCAIDRSSPTSPANPYQLVATATGLTSATSNAFAVGAAASLSLTPSSSVITWAGTVILTARFATSGVGRAITLQGARDGVAWATIATLTTDLSGSASYPYRPVTNLYYRAVFAGAPDLGPATSPTVRVVVRQIALLRPTNLGTIKSVLHGMRVTFTTTVRPSRPELVPATVTYWIYRKVAGVWLPFATRSVVADSLGLARLTWTFSSVGSWYVRSMANPTPWNANSVKSRVEQYRVS